MDVVLDTMNVVRLVVYIQGEGEREQELLGQAFRVNLLDSAMFFV